MIAAWDAYNQLHTIGADHSNGTLAHTSSIADIAKLVMHGVLTPALAAETIRNLTTQMAEFTTEQIDKLAAIANELDPPALDADKPEAATRDGWAYIGHGPDAEEVPVIEHVSPNGRVYEVERA